jgi:DNA-binding NarL/FixJ family response regulator
MLGKTGVSREELQSMQTSIKASFQAVKSELDTHLDSINQNTTELESVFEYLSEIDEKIEKLGQRLDELQLFINPEMSPDKFKVKLTLREQEVFMVLYAVQKQVTLKDIARRLGLTEEMVNNYVFNLISKGIPILKQFKNNQMFLYLDMKFKDLQARKNVLDINKSVSEQLTGDKAI